MTVGGKNISDFCEMSVREELEFLDGDGTRPSGSTLIGDRILKEIRERLGFLQSVGLDYLTLARDAQALCPAARASASAWRPRSAAP